MPYRDDGVNVPSGDRESGDESWNPSMVPEGSDVSGPVRAMEVRRLPLQAKEGFGRHQELAQVA